MLLQKFKIRAIILILPEYFGQILTNHGDLKCKTVKKFRKDKK